MNKNKLSKRIRPTRAKHSFTPRQAEKFQELFSDLIANDSAFQNVKPIVETEADLNGQPVYQKDTALRDWGMNSLDLLHLVIELEDILRLVVSNRRLSTIKTYAQLERIFAPYIPG